MVVTTAPRTVDDVDMTELYSLENHFWIFSDGDPDTFYYDEGDYLFEEAAEGEVIPCCFRASQPCKVLCTAGAVLDTDNIAIPAGFVDIDVENDPASEKLFQQ